MNAHSDTRSLYSLPWSRYRHKDPINLAFSPAGDCLAIASNEEGLKYMHVTVRHLPTNEVLIKRSVRAGYNCHLAPNMGYSHNGRLLTLPTEDSMILIDVENWSTIYKITSTVTSVIFSLDDQCIFGTGSNSDLIIWECATKRSRGIFIGVDIFALANLRSGCDHSSIGLQRGDYKHNRSLLDRFDTAGASSTARNV